MQGIATTTLHYNHQPLEAVQMGGQLWLRVPQLVGPFGFADERGIHNILTRNVDEFTADEARVIVVPTIGGPQEVRVFSLRGARLLALLARTPEAKAFRRWVLDLLEGRVRRTAPQMQLPIPGGSVRLPSDTVRALDAVATLLEEGSEAYRQVLALRDGTAGLPDDPSLDLLVAELEAARQEQGRINRAFRAVRQKARAYGYTMDGVKLAAERRRAAG